MGDATEAILVGLLSIAIWVVLLFIFAWPIGFVAHAVWFIALAGWRSIH